MAIRAFDDTTQKFIKTIKDFSLWKLAFYPLVCERVSVGGLIGMFCRNKTISATCKIGKTSRD